MSTLPADRVTERAEIIFESDALCPCGADPRVAMAHRDPAWFIDQEGEDAVVRCPACW